MVRILFLLFFTSIVVSSRCQIFEYKVFNTLEIPSYYYTEKKNFSDAICSENRLTIKVIDIDGNGVKTSICFGRDNTVYEIKTDTNGYAFVNPDDCDDGSFYIIKIRDGRYNGIEGTINTRLVKKLVIVLGKQSMETVKIKSVKMMTSSDIQKIVNSIKNGVMPKETGLTVDVYLEL